MKIHNLECTQIHYAILNKRHEAAMLKQGTAAFDKLLREFDAWVESKQKHDAQFEETNEKTIQRYCEIRDEYLGGPLYILKAQPILDIEQAFFKKIPEVHLKDSQAGLELMRLWSTFRHKVHLAFEPAITQAINVGCGYVIVTKEAYDLYKAYEKFDINGGPKCISKEIASS